MRASHGGSRTRYILFSYKEQSNKRKLMSEKEENNKKCNLLIFGIGLAHGKESQKPKPHTCENAVAPDLSSGLGLCSSSSTQCNMWERDEEDIGGVCCP